MKQDDILRPPTGIEKSPPAPPAESPAFARPVSLLGVVIVLCVLVYRLRKRPVPAVPPPSIEERIRSLKELTLPIGRGHWEALHRILLETDPQSEWIAVCEARRFGPKEPDDAVEWARAMDMSLPVAGLPQGFSR